MKNSLYIVLALILPNLFSACSPVDSVKVFDNQQAATLVHHSFDPRDQDK